MHHVTVWYFLSAFLKTTFLWCHIVWIFVVNKYFKWGYGVDFKVFECIPEINISDLNKTKVKIKYQPTTNLLILKTDVLNINCYVLVSSVEEFTYFKFHYLSPNSSFFIMTMIRWLAWFLSCRVNSPVEALSIEAGFSNYLFQLWDSAPLKSY